MLLVPVLLVPVLLVPVLPFLGVFVPMSPYLDAVAFVLAILILKRHTLATVTSTAALGCIWFWKFMEYAHGWGRWGILPMIAVGALSALIGQTPAKEESYET